MNIALVTGSYPDMPCGVGDHVIQLGRALRRRGHGVRIITSRDPRVLPEDGVFPVVDSWGPGCDGIVAAHLGDSEILHFQTPTEGYGKSLSARRIPVSSRIKIPVVSTVHEYSNLHWLHRLAMRPVLRGSRDLIVPGERDAEILQARWGKVTPIHCGPTILPSQPPAERDSRQICFFGMIYPGKGIRLLLEARKQLSEYPMTVIGQIHPRHQAMYEELRCDMGDGVTWTGRLAPPEISRLLASCALCLLPYEEGASLRRSSLHCALAHGAPIVTTRPPKRIPALERAVVLVEHPDGRLLAEAARRVLEDPALRENLSRGALRFAEDHSWDVIARKTEEVYRRCLTRETCG